MGMILVTGQPGHGKTAWAIDYAFQLKKEGREIYAAGIKDFDYERAGFHFLQDPKKWEDLPDGSVILLDECYTVFPNRNPGAKVPEHVEATARHRHRGFDFILIAQQGLQLDPFLRGLYEQHIHVRQTSVIKSKTKLKRWTQYQGNVNGPCNDIVDWIRPDYVFQYYTSTTKNTTRRHVPMWLRWVATGCAFLVVMLFTIKWYYATKIERFRAQEAVVASASGAAPADSDFERTDGAAAPKWSSASDYAVAHLPRFPTMPWTAPIFDARPPVSDPQLFCMSSGPGIDANGDRVDGSCSCVTEQGSSYDISVAECRRIAFRGQVYNPYHVTVTSAQPTVPPVDSVPVQSPRIPDFGSSSASPPKRSIENIARYGAMRSSSPN